MAKSLAAQAGALSTEFQLPAAFQTQPEKLATRALSPYITFAHPKRSDEWTKIVSKFGNINEGDMYLMEKDNVTALPKAKVGLLCCKQFWAQVNAAGEIQKVSMKEVPYPYKEHIESVLLVYFDDRIVPANVQFRTTKCPAAKSLADALIKASTPEWEKESPAHKETLAISQPFMRFYGEMYLGPQRTSKTNGMPYRPTKCDVKPTSPSEWRLLDAFTKNPDTKKALEDAANRFESRMAEMAAKAA
jgi:hypothetical protein